MNWLEIPVAAAVARALVHFIWQGALIAALLGVILAALRRASPQARYLAASAAMTASIASFAATALSPVPAGNHFISIPGAGLAPLYSGGDFRTPANAAWGNMLESWALALWLAGVTILLARRTGGWLVARRMLARAAVTAESCWVERLDALRRRMGIARAVGLVESALAQTPAVLGWLRPVILTPAGWLMGLPAEQAEAVLVHELEHVRRHDYVVNLLQSVIEDLLFYHPAVWWVGRVMRRERENCCDDAVLALGGDRRAYARTLASLEGLRAGEPAMAATGGPLAERIRRLVRPPVGPRASAAPLLVAVALVCASAAALPAWQTAIPQPRAAAQAPGGTPYEKWVTEDVVYIISDAERAAFRRLEADEEREHFIEQFWQRRDPTPGTAANEYKEEHYRRIAYTNDHYSDDIAGWKTDRGRIYIMYGPPDEKETHPTGKADGPPYEEWLYRKIEGIGERVIIRFVYEKSNGHFVMQRDPHPGG